jgi:serine/threonine protein phosphatase PrpC
MGTDQPFQWITSARTDVGKVRKVNEDAVLARPEDGLWVVADGMGGHSAGDVASGLIVEEMGEVNVDATLSEVVADVETRLIDVNGKLRDLASSKNISTIGSTFAGMVISGKHGVCMWVGDSRVYRVRNGDIQQLSQDHAFVEDLIEKGILSREDAASHPQSNLVTRAVGAQEHLKVDLEIFELEHEDTYVLCSDGLDKEVTEPDIADMAMREDPTALGDELVREALERGARDNVTVIAVTVRDPSKPALERPSPDMVARAAKELEAKETHADGDAKTDFGRLANPKSPHLLVDHDDVTVRHDDLPPEESAQ